MATNWFEEVKFVLNGLTGYSDNSRSLCQRILAVVDAPYEYTPRDYFLDRCRPMFLSRVRTLETNFSSEVRETYMGEIIDVSIDL